MPPFYLGSVCSVDISLAGWTSFDHADRSTDGGTAATDTLPSVPTMCYPIPETKGLTSWRQRAKTGRNGRFEAQIDSTERAQSSQPEGRGFESHFPLQNTCTLRKAGHFAQPFSPQSGDHLLSRQRHRSARAAGRRPNSMDPAAAYGGRSVSQGQSPVTTAISNLSSAGNCALSLHPRLAHRCCANIPSASQREGARAQMV